MKLQYMCTLRPNIKLLFLSSLSILAVWIFISRYIECDADVGICAVKHELFFLLHICYSLKIIQPLLYAILTSSVLSFAESMYCTIYYKYLLLQFASCITCIAKKLFNIGIVRTINFWQITVVIPNHIIRFLQTEEAILPEV